MAKRKNYMFTNRKHSDKAIMGCILGAISLLSLGFVIFLTYRKGGNAPAGYGVTGLLALVFALTGLILDVTAAWKKENYLLFPWVGIFLNATTLGLIGLLVYLGI